MSDDKDDLHELLRAIALRQQAAGDPIGIYRYAKLAAREYKADPRAEPPKKGYFSNVVFRLANVIAKNEPLTVNERVFLSHLLSALSEGFDVRESLRIDARKVGHNPSQAALNAAIVRELEQRIADGDPPGKAEADIAKITGKTKDAVHTIRMRALRSKSGQ